LFLTFKVSEECEIMVGFKEAEDVECNVDWEKRASYSDKPCPVCGEILRLSGYVHVLHKELSYGTSEWYIHNLYVCLGCRRNVVPQ